MSQIFNFDPLDNPGVADSAAAYLAAFMYPQVYPAFLELWQREAIRRRRLLVLVTCVISQVFNFYHSLFLTPSPRIPYHTSALTGYAWVCELLTGHPDRIKHNLGVSLEVFEALVLVLQANGFEQSRNGVSVEEQLAIFLYTCVTGLSTRLLGERFQRSPDTISRYFRRLLVFFSEDVFYDSQVRFPTDETPISTTITNDPRFRFFRDCIGAVDGTHIRVFSANEDHDTMRNRKGYLSQNCLFICDFDFAFIYSLCGWDGSVADAALWHDAHQHDLRIPEGRYLLADAGFGSCDTLLVPYRGVRYHLKEWRQADVAPQTPKELFNHRHACLRNFVEHIFGVMKRQWRILQLPPEYGMEIQARIPGALCALHNFIHKYDPDTFEVELDGEVFAADGGGSGELAEGPADRAERRRAEIRREAITAEMWEDYCAELVRRGLPVPDQN